MHKKSGLILLTGIVLIVFLVTLLNVMGKASNTYEPILYSGTILQVDNSCMLFQAQCYIQVDNYKVHSTPSFMDTNLVGRKVEIKGVKIKDIIYTDKTTVSECANCYIRLLDY